MARRGGEKIRFQTIAVAVRTEVKKVSKFPYPHIANDFGLEPPYDAWSGLHAASSHSRS